MKASIVLGVSALLACGWYAGVYRPAEAAIAERYDELTRLRASIEHGRVLMARAGALARGATELERQLRPAAVPQTGAEALDRFFADLSGVVQRHDLQIENIQPAAAPADDLPMDVTLRGPYAAVFTAVRDLAQRSPAAQIAVTNLRIARRTAAQPAAIDATFHITLVRPLPDATTSPAPHPA
jgi:hypothetical protein